MEKPCIVSNCLTMQGFLITYCSPCKLITYCSPCELITYCSPCELSSV